MSERVHTTALSQSVRSWLNSRWSLLLAGVACGLIPLLLDGGGRDSVRLWLANALPWLLLWLCALGLTRRPLFAASLTWLLAAVVYQVNQIKLRELGLPLVPSDVLVFDQMLSSPALYWRYLRLPSLPQLLLLLLLIESCRRSWRLRPLCRPLRFAQALLFVLAGGVLLSVQQRWAPWPQIYDQEDLRISFWHAAAGAEQAGMAAHFMLLQQNTRSTLPPALPGIEDAYVERFGPRPPMPMPSERVDLIVVQSESFFDPGDLVDLDSERYIPNLRALSERFPHGRLRVPTFGGLTTRTEFEFLTGYPLMVVPEIQYPFQGLVHRPMYAVPWALRELGYQTRALHPYDPNFYGRKRVYPLLGFQAFHSIGDFRLDEYHGYYVSDHALNRRIIELLDSPVPTFLFAVSIENHGPWDELRPVPAAELAQINLPARGSEAARAPLAQFLVHLRRTDQALGELADWVMQRERPTVLLFYGDHLPNLVSTFAEWPTRDGQSVARQTVPWVLVDNRMREPAPQRIDLSSSELAAVLLQHAGLEALPLFADITRLRNAEPALSQDERIHWHSQLAAAQLESEPDLSAWQLRDVTFAEVEKWGPQSQEQHPDATEGVAVYVDLDQPVSEETVLMINQNRLEIAERTERHLVGILDLASSRTLLAEPGQHQVYLLDRMQRQRQWVGELTVRPRGRRVGGLLGLGAGPFCAISAWGPEQSALEPVANRQPDGQMGLWARSECFPAGARLRFDDRLLETALDGELATALIPPEWLSASTQRRVALVSSEGEVMPLGQIEVLASKPATVLGSGAIGEPSH
ncbi:MAG: LTA synthase family protein [Xanthomonadales bacterium]|nr:LTA synthase family protein [Xanthomonadales bacterium]